MRAFPVPIQITGRERLIGGILDIKQLSYIVLGVVLGGAALFTSMPVILRLLGFIAASGAGLVFAFARVHNMEVDVYLFRWLRWRISRRTYYLEGSNRP